MPTGRRYVNIDEGWKPIREELAWAAGFFDGEGYIGSRDSKKGLYFHPRISIAQVRPEPLARFRNAIGFGKIHGPWKSSQEKNPNISPKYTYVVTGFEGCQALIGLIGNWLSLPKQEQATSALKNCLQQVRPRSTKRGGRKGVVHTLKIACRFGHSEDWYISPGGKRACNVCRRKSKGQMKDIA